MKITCLRENFKKAVNLVERATGISSSLPILKNILIKNDKEKILVAATNLELAVLSWFSAKIENEGKTTIPVNILSNVLNSITDEKLNLEIKKDTLHFKTDKYKTIIQGLPAEDFPIIPKVEEKNKIEIDIESLRQGLERVISAAASTEVRPEISGVLFKYTKNLIKLVATDSFRLSEKTMDNKNFRSNLAQDCQFIIPLKTCQELVRILEISPRINEYLKLTFDQNQILFDLGETQIISKLINANFPEYESYIPNSFNTQLILNKEDLVEALKLSSIFSGRINDIKLKIPETLKNLEVFSQESTVGQNQAFLEAKIEGAPLEIAFNYRFLLDGVRTIKDPNIFIGLNQSSQPALFKGIEDNSHIYILMPIKT